MALPKSMVRWSLVQRSAIAVVVVVASAVVSERVLLGSSAIQSLSGFRQSLITVNVASVAMCVALGSFVIQMLKRSEDDLIRYGLERTRSVAKRILEVGRVPLMLMLKMFLDGHPNLKLEVERLMDYVSSNLPEEQDNKKVVCFVSQYIPEKADRAERAVRWRTDFLELIARIDTAEPQLATVKQICDDLNKKVAEYTNQESAKAAMHIMGRAEHNHEGTLRVTKWLEWALSFFAFGLAMGLVAQLLSDLSDLSSVWAASCTLACALVWLCGALCACALVGVILEVVIPTDQGPS